MEGRESFRLTLVYSSVLFPFHADFQLRQMFAAHNKQSGHGKHCPFQQKLFIVHWKLSNAPRTTWGENVDVRNGIRIVTPIHKMWHKNTLRLRRRDNFVRWRKGLRRCDEHSCRPCGINSRKIWENVIEIINRRDFMDALWCCEMCWDSR